MASNMDIRFSPKKSLSDNVQIEEVDGNTKDRNTNFDVIDGLRKKANFNWFDILCIFISIISYLADLITDAIMAANYFYQKDYWYFALTVTFVLIPAITMSGLSTKWYIKDRNKAQVPSISTFRWCIRIFCLVFFLSPIARYIDALHYGLQSRKAKRKSDTSIAAQYYAHMAYEDADATFLRLFECFMESAPQLVLQLYIIAKSTNEDTLTIILQSSAVITSVISLAWALTSYNRSLRFAQTDKENIHIMGTTILFLAHLFGIIARVLALSLFASVYYWLIWLVCFGHWILMVAWLLLQKTTACSTRTEEFLFCLVLAIIHIFTFFNVKPDRTLYRYLFYYTVCLIENTVLIVFWFINVDSLLWYSYPSLVGQIGSFFLSVCLLMVYYRWFHPNVLPAVAICTKETVCLSNLKEEAEDDHEANSSGSSPARLGRLDVVHLDDIKQLPIE